MPCPESNGEAFFGCCEVEPPAFVCSRSTSYGIATIGVWKNDSLGFPTSGRPYCTLYSKFTITVMEGAVTHCRVVLKSRFEHGTKPDLSGASGGWTPVVESITGGNPCTGGETFMLTLGGLTTDRNPNGFSLSWTCSNTPTVERGKIIYELSDPVSKLDADAAASVLSSLVDWNSLANGVGQKVEYSPGGGGVITTPSQLEFCTNQQFANRLTASGRTYSASRSSNALLPPEFQTTLSWLPTRSTSGTNALIESNIKISATVWQSRLTLPPPWCRYEGAINAAFAGACPLNIGVANGCLTPVLVGTNPLPPVNTTLIEPPPATPMTYVIYGCTYGSFSDCS